MRNNETGKKGNSNNLEFKILFKNIIICYSYRIIIQRTISKTLSGSRYSANL